MFWISSSLIVVAATTTKPYRENLSWTTPLIMEPEGNHNCDKSTGSNSSQPDVLAIKSKVKNILPSVHSAVAAASPLFNSYRSVFQSWKHSVPKLYKYPSSDIEVVVYRKNGEVERLSSQKRSGPEDHEQFSEIEEQSTKGLTHEEDDDNKFGPFSARLNDDHESSLKLAIDVNENDCKRMTEELNFVPLEEHTLQSVAEKRSPDFITSQLKQATCSNSNSNKLDVLLVCTPETVARTNCEFIFSRKCKLSSVPSNTSSVKVQTFPGFVETRTISLNTLPTTADKPSQVGKADLPPLDKSDSIVQCNLNQQVSNSAQTEQILFPAKLDFSQIFPVTWETANQTGFTAACANSSAQTLSGELKDAASQSENEATPVLVSSVEWHGNVPCCHGNIQTDAEEAILLKDQCAQAVPELISTPSQVESDLKSGMKDSGTSVAPEVAHVSVQLSASCCYFTRKRERKLYEKKLDAARNEIICFYESNCRQLNASVAAGQDKFEEEELSASGNTGPGFAEDDEVAKPIDEIDEATQQLRILEEEVEQLRENSIMLKTSLESMENTSYFEDSWIRSDC